MAFVIGTRLRPKRATDPYSARLARRDRGGQINVNIIPRVGHPAGFLPPGSLAAAVAGLGDLGDGTGISFIDSNLTAIRQQVDAAALAAKITAVCSIAAGVASVLLLIRTGK